jgi:hypothetical protein
VLFERACDDDEPEGCLELAISHETGRGVPQDYERAGDLYRDVCEGDVAIACARLADLHAKGAGVFRDEKMAERLRQKACTLGHAESCARPQPAPPAAPARETAT